jgi:tetratricopeptide (TPR) repeat protein
MNTVKKVMVPSILLVFVLLLFPDISLMAQGNSGQYRMFVFPFKLEDVNKREAAKFNESLRTLLMESGRYELTTQEELKEVQRGRDMNVRAIIPDSLTVQIAKELGARIMLTGNLVKTQQGTIKTTAMLVEVLSGKEKKLGFAEISIGTDISVLSQSLVDLIYRRADIDKYMDFGRDYLRSHIFDRAADNFKKALAIDSTVVDGYYYLGNAHLQLNDTTAAIVNYETTIKRDSTYKQAAHRLGNLYIQRGEFEKSITLFNALINVDQKNSNYYLYAGIAYHQAGNLDEALAAYEKGREVDPDELLFSENMARIYYEQEKYDLAAENFEKVAEFKPDNIEILQYVASCYNQFKNYEGATATYEKIVAIDPAFHQGYKNLGIWYGKLKQYDKAIEALEKGLEFSPEEDKPDIYLSLVDVYQKANKYYKVIQVGQKALKYQKNVQIYVFMGDAYQSIGEDLERENTVESYTKAIGQYEASTTNYSKVVNDSKYGSYAKKSMERNKSLIDRANLIIKKLKLDQG